jgi:hypothetical protein
MHFFCLPLFPYLLPVGISLSQIRKKRNYSGSGSLPEITVNPGMFRTGVTKTGFSRYVSAISFDRNGSCIHLIALPHLSSLIAASPRMGRYSIKEALARRGNDLSEGKLRSILKELSDEGLIKINRTRGGCEITELGMTVL